MIYDMNVFKCVTVWEVRNEKKLLIAFFISITRLNYLAELNTTPLPLRHQIWETSNVGTDLKIN